MSGMKTKAQAFVYWEDFNPAPATEEEQERVFSRLEGLLGDVDWPPVREFQRDVERMKNRYRVASTVWVGGDDG